jgi:multiple sugar transport system ATP-binding protein
VKDVDLEIADKEFVALVGPSGCGKSTTLRMIAGLEDISSGDIRIGGRLVNNLPPRDRDVAMVFQNYALYQHMSVYDNLAFGLRNKKRRRSRDQGAIDRAAGHARPARAAAAQAEAIVRRPAAARCARPLHRAQSAGLPVRRAAVEPGRQAARPMRIEIKRLHAQIPTTSVFVTHDQIEAMTLGRPRRDHARRRVQQIGTPLQVYEKPANKFVAGFIGAPAMNFIDVTVRSAAV